MPEAAQAGFILCDKPAGVTSHDVVARVRRELGLRVGHAGTLDPFATGLLVLLVGRATRLQRYVLGQSKTYLATARLGWRSSTGDSYGELTETGNRPERLVLPVGVISQRVPMTSAVRVDGERLYKKAQRGEEVETPVREVFVEFADLLERTEDTATFEIHCSSGTYVRTLIEELGDAYCESLCRTAVGDLKLSDASERVLPVEELVAYLPAIELAPDAARLVRNGIKVEPPETAAVPLDKPLRLMCEERLVAVARIADGLLRTEVVLP